MCVQLTVTTVSGGKKDVKTQPAPFHESILPANNLTLMNFSHLKRPALHLFAVSSALLVIGCGESKPDSAWWQGENERIGLEHDLQLKQFRFEQAYSEDFNKLQVLNKSNDAATASLALLRSQKEELTTAVASLEGNWEEFRRTAILQQRQRAKSQTFDELNLVSGKNFRTVSVSSIDDGGVTIRHEYGSAKLRYADLTADQRLLFGIEEDLAVAAEGREKKDALAYERWVENRLVAIREEKQKDANAEERKEIAAERRRLLASAAATRDLVAANTSPLAKPARNVSSSTRYGSTRYYSYYYGSYRRCTPVYRAYCAPRSYVPSSQMHYLRTGRMQGSTPTPTY